VFSGGLSSAATSTATVFTLTRSGRGATAGPLPGPVHDAAQAQLSTQLFLFGGGQSEGSDRIVRVLPAPARVVGRIPQALSDLDAVVVDNVAYVIGGWNGTETNRAIYAAKPTVPSAGPQVHTVAELPLGVRYPAAAALAGHVIVAGGETTSGAPTPAAWSFDPATGAVTPLPSLPAPTDHAPGAAINGRFYVLGGLRRGTFTDAILSWAPGERRWRTAGRLPRAISDATAVSLPNAIAVMGGRGASGATATVTWLAARAG
jgi:N-acetylneuraminic acid mutarotase